MVKPLGLYDHESVSIVERNLQTPFNSLIMARTKITRPIRSARRVGGRGDTAKSCDELAAGDLIVIPRNESQLHRHQCGNGEAYRHSRLYQQNEILPSSPLGENTNSAV